MDILCRVFGHRFLQRAISVAEIHSPPDLAVYLLVPLVAEKGRRSCVLELHYLHPTSPDVHAWVPTGHSSLCLSLCNDLVCLQTTFIQRTKSYRAETSVRCFVVHLAVLLLQLVNVGYIIQSDIILR